MKVYNAYKRAIEHKGGPTVILAKTVKGYGLGEAGEGRNITHQQKKLNEEELVHFRDRFDIPIPEEAVHKAAFYRPPKDSPEMQLHARAARGAGRLSCRSARVPARSSSRRPPLEYFKERWPARAAAKPPPPWPLCAS